MRKLLFLFTMLALFVACSDDDDKDNELPIKGLEIPKFENPVKPGESITIKGEGFTKASEIWFRTIVTRAENTGDVKAIVSEVNSTGITFTAPEVYGNQSVLLKENGKEYELGKMTFEEQPEEGGDIEILPKKISKVIVSEGEDYDYTYEYTYKDEKIVSVKRTDKPSNDITTSTYTYSSDKITIEIHESPISYNANVTLALKDNKLSVYTRNEDEKGDKSAYKYEYTYSGDYISYVEGDEDGDWSKETFSFIEGKFMTYKYETDGYFDFYEYTYDNQLNNLNIDLFTYIAWDWDSWSGEEGFLLEIIGKRSQYLPSSMKWTTEDEEDGQEPTEYVFSYKMDGEYITEMTITEKTGEKSTTKIQIFYED